MVVVKDTREAAGTFLKLARHYLILSCVIERIIHSTNSMAWLEQLIRTWHQHWTYIHHQEFERWVRNWNWNLNNKVVPSAKKILKFKNRKSRNYRKTCNTNDLWSEFWHQRKQYVCVHFRWKVFTKATAAKRKSEPILRVSSSHNEVTNSEMKLFLLESHREMNSE